jgi:hypothetical protein
MALLNASSNSKTNKAAVVLEGGVDLALWILQELVADTTSVAVRDPPLASDVVLLLRNLVTESSASQVCAPRLLPGTQPFSSSVLV